MTNVQSAVAQREDQRAKTPTLGDFVKTTITRQAQDLSAVLPGHLDTERYSALVLTAMKANDKLMHAFRTEQGQLSVLLSVMQAAALGLEPNTPLQECWLLPRRVKDGNDYRDECELSIGYKGYAKLARRSGRLKELIADVVRDGDDFSWSRGLERDEFHHRKLSDDGELTHAYAIARMHDGSVAFTVMSRAQVEKRRAVSESWKNDKARPFSPWTKWEPEQWRKTAMRQLMLHGEVDLSPELITAANSDEAPLGVTDGVVRAVTSNAVAELAPPSAPPGAAADTGDRQEPASPSQGEGEPPEGEAGQGAPPAADDTVDPTTWSANEWRDQIRDRKIKISDVIKEADRISKETRQLDGPGTIDDLADRPDIAIAVAQWMGV